MIRHTVGAMRWRDLWCALLPQPDAPAQLRQALANQLGVPDDALWLTGAGRSALFAFVSATRRSPQDEALLPGYTCVVVPNVFLHAGVKVSYVDLPEGGVNPTACAWMQAVTPQTRWLVWPHNFGLVSQEIQQALAELRQRFPNLLVIEDAAHAWGVKNGQGQAAGTWADASFFSFEYSKCFTTGLGGALLVNQAALRPAVAQVLAKQHLPGWRQQAKVVATLAYHLALATWPGWLMRGISAVLRAPSRALGWVAATRPAELSGQAQPDYWQALPPRLAALALPQLARWTAVAEARRAQAAHYALVLQGSDWLSWPLELSGHAAHEVGHEAGHEADSAAWGAMSDATPGRISQAAPASSHLLLRFPVIVSRPEQRDALRSGLLDLGIEPGAWFEDVVHPTGSFRHGYTAGDCPNGERLALCIVNLPLGLHAGLSPCQWKGLRRLALQAQMPAALAGDRP